MHYYTRLDDYPEERLLFNAKQAAALLGVSNSTIGHWVRKGILRGAQPGPYHSYRIPREAIEKALTWNNYKKE